jgi:hypothetical protein
MPVRVSEKGSGMNKKRLRHEQKIFTGYSQDIHRQRYSQDIHRIFTGYSQAKIFTGYSQDIHRIFTAFESGNQPRSIVLSD